MEHSKRLDAKKSRSLQGARLRINRKKSRSRGNAVTFKNLEGGRFDPGTNPPSVDAQTWMHQVLVDTFKITAKGGIYTINTIADQLRGQLDPTKHGMNQGADYRIQFRIKSIRAWNLTGRLIGLSVEDFSDTSKNLLSVDQLCGLIDTGTPTHTPALGYHLPLAHQSHVLRNDAEYGGMHICDITGGTGDTLMVYFSLMWRFDGPFRVPISLIPIDEILARTRRDMRRGFGETITAIDKMSSSIQGSMPDTTDKIVDNVTHLASYVTTVMADDDRERIDRLENQLSRVLNLLEVRESKVSDWSVCSEGKGDVSLND